MYWESYSCESQIDEMIPEWYEDWLQYCAQPHEAEEESNI